MTVRAWLIAVPLALAAPAPGAGEEVVVGSKKFTESVILGEAAAQLVRDAGVEARHRRQLGGTRVLWKGLQAGEIDAYPEYTGTIAQEILADTEAAGTTDRREMVRVLEARGVGMTRPLGFDNTYALGMNEEVAAELGVERVSDLLEHPGLRFGFTNEFMDREDGWPGLRRRYGLPQDDVRGLDHDLAYRGLESGDLQVIDLYSTDAEIRYYGLRVLDDDLGYFPEYAAVILYRLDLRRRAPAAVAALERLEGRLSAADMVAMNARAKLDRVPESTVAAAFLEQHLGVEPAPDDGTSGFWARLRLRTREHLVLVGLSLLAAVLVSVPLGVVAAKRPVLGQGLLGVAGIFQTIPSLALLVFMIPLFGIGGPPAMVALFLYSLLPILRNTTVGLTSIPRELTESAEVLGLDFWARLRRVELPLATPAILAGIKISAVINIGTATLGALIGAGGYGQPILTGIRLDDLGLILEGAVPAAGLALLAQGLFELAERRLVPRGLRQ